MNRNPDREATAASRTFLSGFALVLRRASGRMLLTSIPVLVSLVVLLGRGGHAEMVLVVYAVILAAMVIFLFVRYARHQRRGQTPSVKNRP